MSQHVRIWLADHRGATAVEYGLVAAGIGVAITASVFALGVDVARLFGGVGTSVTGGDGALEVDAARPALLSPLVNGGFEADIGGRNWTWTAVEGWSNSGSGGRIELWNDGFLGTNAPEGSTFIELDAHRIGGIDHLQTSVDLEAGGTYTMSFEHAARAGAGENDEFEITHNGVVITTIAPGTPQSFTTAEVTLTGADGPDVIGFRELPGQNNGVGVLLDNVRFE